MKILSENLQDYLNNNNTKNKQEKLSKIQLLKINYIAENYKQNSKSDNNNSVSQHNRKAWHALITINESMSE